MKKEVKYRTIKDNDSIVIITEDGGYAVVISIDENKATSEYYQNKFTKEDVDSGSSIHEVLSEGKMYYNEWDTNFDSIDHIENALDWLVPDCTYEYDENIWSNLKVENL